MPSGLEPLGDVSEGEGAHGFCRQVLEPDLTRISVGALNALGFASKLIPMGNGMFTKNDLFPDMGRRWKDIPSNLQEIRGQR